MLRERKGALIFFAVFASLRETYLRVIIIAEMSFARLILLYLLLSATALSAAAQPNQYLLGRNAERTGDIAGATAHYQAIASSDSVLREYALWHLAKIARSTGDLVLERERLQQLIAVARHIRSRNNCDDARKSPTTCRNP